MFQTPSLTSELTILLNQWNQEKPSNTPDYLLANYLIACLNAYNEAVVAREKATQAFPINSVQLTDH